MEYWNIWKSLPPFAQTHKTPLPYRATSYLCLLLECTSVIRTAPFKVKHGNTWCLCETIPEGLQIQLRKNAMSCGREDKCYTGRRVLLIVTNLLAPLKCLCLKKETECDRKTTLNRNVILLLYRDFLVNFGMQLQSHTHQSSWNAKLLRCT